MPRHRLALVWFAIPLAIAAVLSALALWIYSNAHTPFGYMVTGALGTTVFLVSAFLWLWSRKLL